MRVIILFLVFQIICMPFVKAEDFTMCPLCTKEGEITCPNGYAPACNDKVPFNSKPTCIFYGDRFVSGCWKFEKMQKLDLGLDKLFPGAKVEIIGGGQTYTLNREIVGCRKL